MDERGAPAEPGGEVERVSDGPEPDILVVGAGIGGAALALALAGRGWRVRMLERETSPPPICRPEILQESTIDALERLGTGPRLREEASLPLRSLDLRRGRESLVRIDEADFTAAGFAPRSVDPARVRALLLETAESTGRIDLIRGAEVTDVVRAGARVTGVRARQAGCTIEARGRLVVGDDGVRSVVRGSLGIRARMRLFPLEFVVVGLDRPPGVPGDAALAWIDPGALRHGIAAAVFVPQPGGRLAGVLLMPFATWERQFAGEPEPFWESLARLTPLAAALREQLVFPDDFTRLRRPYGHVPSYVADGAALIGDAAHPMSPAGGQGANAAVWDALALADVADAALRDGDLSAARLAAYDWRRRPANVRSLRFTRRAVAFIRLGRWLPGGGRLLTGLLRQAGRDAAGKRLLLRQAATAFLDAGPRR